MSKKDETVITKVEKEIEKEKKELEKAKLELEKKEKEILEKEQRKLEEAKIIDQEYKRPMIDMKSHILTVAASLMIKKGIKNTSLKDISKEAGISKGTLYYYYSAKEDIIYDIAINNIEQITDEMINLLNHQNKDIDLVEILNIFFNKILTDEERGILHLYLINEAVSNNETLKDKFNNEYKNWHQILVDNLNRVNKDEEKNDIIAYLILALTDGFSIQKMAGFTDIPYSKIINYILKK